MSLELRSDRLLYSLLSRLSTNGSSKSHKESEDDADPNNTTAEFIRIALAEAERVRAARLQGEDATPVYRTAQ